MEKAVEGVVVGSSNPVTSWVAAEQRVFYYDRLVPRSGKEGQFGQYDLTATKATLLDKQSLAEANLLHAMNALSLEVANHPDLDQESLLYEEATIAFHRAWDALNSSAPSKGKAEKLTAYVEQVTERVRTGQGANKLSVAEKLREVEDAVKEVDKRSVWASKEQRHFRDIAEGLPGRSGKVIEADTYLKGKDPLYRQGSEYLESLEQCLQILDPQSEPKFVDVAAEHAGTGFEEITVAEPIKEKPQPRSKLAIGFLIASIFVGLGASGLSIALGIRPELLDLSGVWKILAPVVAGVGGIVIMGVGAAGFYGVNRLLRPEGDEAAK
jgi:hypothetical protein